MVARLRVHNFAVSLDGYAAGPDQSLDNPLGVRGTELHEWVFETRFGRKMIGQEGGTEGVATWTWTATRRRARRLTRPARRGNDRHRTPSQPDPADHGDGPPGFPAPRTIPYLANDDENDPGEGSDDDEPY
jgi:hypothetical protein